MWPSSISRRAIEQYEARRVARLLALLDAVHVQPDVEGEAPPFEVEHLERPDPNTPLGMKGMAEG